MVVRIWAGPVLRAHSKIGAYRRNRETARSYRRQPRAPCRLFLRGHRAGRLKADHHLNSTQNHYSFRWHAAYLQEGNSSPVGHRVNKSTQDFDGLRVQSYLRRLLFWFFVFSFCAPFCCSFIIVKHLFVRCKPFALYRLGSTGKLPFLLVIFFCRSGLRSEIWFPVGPKKNPLDRLSCRNQGGNRDHFVIC